MSRARSISMYCVTLWSSRRHSALESESREFESCSHEVGFETTGKALYMHFISALRFKMYPWLQAVKDHVGMLE